MGELRWLRRWSLRTRIVAVAAVVVTAVLVAGGLLLGWALRHTLTEDLHEAAVLRAHDLASVAVRGALSDPIPVGDADEALVQVVTDAGVVSASGNASGLPPLNVRRPPLGETAVHTAQRLPVADELDEGFVVAATTVAGPTGAVTVYVASSLEDVNETLSQAGSVALVGLPVLVAALVTVMWLLVGRVLAPVDAIRHEADEISGRDLHRRVPEPAADDEIGRLAHTLNRMLGRLEQSLERQRRFVADAAHELRTPITSLHTQVETARGSSRTVDWADVADDVLDETLRLEQLIEQLLVLAGADAGVPTSQQQPVDLDDIILRLAAAYRDDPDLQIDVSNVQPVQVTGSPILLEQAIRNLIDNAHQHAHSRIEIHCGQNEHGVVVRVDDDGPGVPGADRKHIFERFTRLDHARTRDAGGAGLGLAIVADAVSAHGGDVTVTDSPFGGARFEIRLPTSQ